MATAVLEDLGRKLLQRAAPPSLSAILEKLDESGEYQEFMSLVHKFTPEIEQDIGQFYTPQAKMQKFALAFEHKYFPLHPRFAEGWGEGYYDLVRFIPVIVLSIDWDDYETLAEGSWRNGLMLAAFIAEDPYHRVEYEHTNLGGGESARVAMGEACANVVPQHILKRVPRYGIKPEELHKLLDGTRFEAMALVSDILHMDAGNVFHDNNAESIYDGAPALEWDMENVSDITRGWLRAQAIEQKVAPFYDWLEQNPTQNLTELLDFIDDRREEMRVKTEAIQKYAKFKPRQSDIDWIKKFIAILGIGGKWIAPAGFEFQKVSNKEFKLVGISKDPKQHAEALELIGRTVAVGRAAHIIINIDDLDKLLAGGEHGNTADSNRRSPSAPARAAGRARRRSRPTESQGRLL